jgi:hypothetical protein
LIALPTLAVALLGARARVLLPKIRDWMNAHAWLVSEAVIRFFLVIMIASYVSKGT